MILIISAAKPVTAAAALLSPLSSLCLREHRVAAGGAVVHVQRSCCQTPRDAVKEKTTVTARPREDQRADRQEEERTGRRRERMEELWSD